MTALFSTYAIAVLATLLSVGRISDDVRRRPVVRVGLAILVVSGVLFMAARGLGWLFLARAVQGVATGVLAGAGSAALVELGPAHDAKRASLLATVSFVLGAAAGSMVGGVAAEQLPWPTVLPFAIELGLIAVAAALTSLVPKTLATGDRPRLRVQRIGVPDAIVRVFVIASMAVGVAWSVGALYGPLAGTVAAKLLHTRSRAVTGALLGAFNLVAVLAQLAWRARPSWSTLRAGVATTVAGMVVVAASVSAGSLALFAFRTALSGVGPGLAFTGSFATVNQLAPAAARAETLSALNAVAYLSLAFPVVGLGLLTEHTSLQSAIQGFTVVLVLVGIAVLVACTRRGRPSEVPERERR